jgi:hypothetical protein
LRVSQTELTTKFVKQAYTVIGNENVTYVAYYGDEKLVVPFQHGNSKRSDPHFRTKPSAIEEIKDQIKDSDPHIVYNKNSSK